MMNADQVQHINLKVFVENPDAINIEDAVPVFHQWIRDGIDSETLVDVAVDHIEHAWRNGFERHMA